MLSFFCVCAAVEAEFQQHVAVRRRPILLLVFCFDVICYLFRMCVKFTNTIVTFPAILTGILPQLCNMAFLYFFLGLLNRRSRRLGDNAARQVSNSQLGAYASEEMLVVIGLAVKLLLFWRHMQPNESGQIASQETVPVTTDNSLYIFSHI